MQKIAICATLYEAGRPYLEAFIAGVTAAARGHDVTLVTAVDGLRDAGDALSALPPDIAVLRVNSPGGLTPAAMRRVMLMTGYTSGADVLVFNDMDDVLTPGALTAHCAVLADADISFGDMAIIDKAGEFSGRHFFDEAGVPDRIDDVAVMRERNFLGFSNTAIRASRMPVDALSIPDDVVAADWWFFTAMLIGGCRAARTGAPVAAYRVYDNNLLGAGAPSDPASALLQAQALLRHYRAFPTIAAFSERAAAAERQIETLRQMPTGLQMSRLAGLADRPGVWFEHITALLTPVESAAETIFATA